MLPLTDVGEDAFRDLVDVLHPLGGELHADGEDREVVERLVQVAAQPVGPLLALERGQDGAGRLVAHEVREVLGGLLEVVRLHGRQREQDLQRLHVLDRHGLHVLGQLLGAHRVRGEERAGEVLVWHEAELGCHPGLQRVQILLAVHHQAHQVRRVVALVELDDLVARVEPLGLWDAAERVQVAGGEGVQRVVLAHQRLEQLPLAP